MRARVSMKRTCKASAQRGQSSSSSLAACSRAMRMPQTVQVSQSRLRNIAHICPGIGTSRKQPGRAIAGNLRRAPDSSGFSVRKVTVYS